MREATYEDAVSIGRLLNVHRDEVWKILKGLRYSSESELSMAVHNAFKRVHSATAERGDDEKTA